MEYRKGDYVTKKKKGKTKPALEKLKAIPIGKRIKVSHCDSVEVQYVIWRTGEDEYKIERKCQVPLYDMMVHQFGWDFDEADFWEKMHEVEVEVYGKESRPMPENFELQCYYYETIRGLTAQEVIELEGIRNDYINGYKLAHDIDFHELYEIPTKGGYLQHKEEKK